MITIEKLKSFGANTDEGLQRCMNNKDFYLMLVNKSIGNNQIPALEEAINNSDLQKAFEVAHSLKGVYGNLSLTPLYNAVVEITEPLRNKVSMDYAPLLNKLKALFQSLVELSK